MTPFTVYRRFSNVKILGILILFDMVSIGIGPMNIRKIPENENMHYYA